MDAFQKSLIHTIAFYDGVGSVPLTRLELYKRRVRIEPSPMKISFPAFCKSLEEHKTALSPYIACHRGFYFLKKNPAAYEKRVAIGKTSIEKWRIAQRMGRIISFLPYVRMVAITGSLVQYTTTQKSDIDVFIVARGGHIWTTRMFVSVAMHILGKRRHGNKIRDRICLNHYVADTDLALRPNHLFSAHIGSSFVPLWSKSQTKKLFAGNNKRLIKACFPQYRKEYTHLKSLPPSFPPFYAFSTLFEKILGSHASRGLELLLKKIQTNKIRNSAKKDGHQKQEVIFDDSALVFHHPRPKNREALFLYKENTKNLRVL